MAMSDTELRHRKRLQGHISQTTATLGLTALGARAAGTKSVGRLAKIPAKTGEKLKNASTGLTTLGAGIGGAGGYNFAAYTKAESQRRQPVGKEFAMLDFGLDGVRSGRNILAKDVSKAMTPEERKARRQEQGINNARKQQRRSETDAAVFGGAVGAMAYKRPAAAGHRVGHFIGRKVAEHRLKGEGFSKPFSAKKVPYQSQKKAVGTVLRAEHIGRNAGALGAVAAGGAGGYAWSRSHRKKLTYGKEKVPVFKAATSMEKLPTVDERVNDAGGVPQSSFKPTASYQRPQGRSKSTQGVVSTGATKINSRPNSVYKAYDPERNRQRRMDHYSTGAAMGAGAAAAGAASYGASAVRSVKGQHIPKYIKMGAKNAGRSAGLGAAAIGGAVAADRIRAHKQGRGRPYSPRSY